MFSQEFITVLVYCPWFFSLSSPLSSLYLTCLSQTGYWIYVYGGETGKERGMKGKWEEGKEKRLPPSTGLERKNYGRISRVPFIIRMLKDYIFKS